MEAAKILLARGDRAVHNSPSGVNELMLSLQGEKSMALKSIELLSKYGKWLGVLLWYSDIDVNQLDNKKANVLFYLNEHPDEVVRKLLTMGASLSQRDVDGFSSVELAIKKFLSFIEVPYPIGEIL